MDSTGKAKLFSMWACGTTDLVTDIIFLVNSIKIHFALVNEEDGLGHGFFFCGCLWCLMIIVGLHLWKLVCICCIMNSDSSDPDDFECVTLANSPGLFFISCCRPSKLDDFVDFIQAPHPWNSRILVDMVLEDIPSLALNSADMFHWGNDGFLNWLSFLASIAHSLVCWWLLRSRDTRGQDVKAPRPAQRVEDGISAMNSVVGVAEAVA